MFIKKKTSYEDSVLTLFKADDDSLEYFKLRCCEENIFIYAVNIAAKGEHEICSDPYMALYVTNPSDYNAYGPGNGGLYDDTKKKVLTLWYETCRKFNLKEKKYYTGIQFGLVLLHEEIYSYLVRKYKDEIEREICKVALCKPRYVFASSSGYISIIFNEEDYQSYDLWNRILINQITTFINKKKEQLFGKIDLIPIKVNIYHNKMKDINLYGLSRED